MVAVKDLRPHPKNRNKHPQEQIDRFCKILKEQGIRRPVRISKLSGYITAGHGLLLAAKKLKLKELPCDFQDYKDESQEYADIQADNALASWAELDFSGINADIGDFGPDFDIDLLGIKNFSIDVSDKDPQCDEDEVPEKVDPKTRLGDIYTLGDHRLMCGDSTSIDAVEKLMDGTKADMVFTDPPYGISVVKSEMVGANFGIAKKGKYKFVNGDETIDCAKYFYQTCKSAGFNKFIIWGGNYFTEFLEPSGSWVIWNKRAGTDIVNTFADVELAWSNIGFPARIHNQLWNGMIRSGEKGMRVHPTQKPIALAEFCFDLMKETRSVFDGFGGSGSTLIACEKTNRKCFMMELDPHYCDVIVARWEKYTGKKAVLSGSA